jgi:hypothetical protein
MRTLLAACVVVLLAAAGCGGSDEQAVKAGTGDPGATTTTVAVPETDGTTATTAPTATSTKVPGSQTTTSTRRATTPTTVPKATTTTAPAVAGRWSTVDSGPLATRGEPKAVWTGREVVVVGGLIIDQYQALADGAAFDPAAGTWRRIADRPVPGRVLWAVWTGTEVFTLGSNRIDLDPITTAYAYNPATDHWRAVALPPAPNTPRAAAWTGSRILLWQPGEAAPGALWDPAADNWTPIPANTVPGAASAGAAVWTGKALAVEGAVTPAHGGPVEQRLFLFDPAAMTWRVSSRPPVELSAWPNLGAGSAAGRVVVVGPPADTPGGAGRAIVYDPATDRWAATPAPFSNAAYAAEVGAGVLALGTGPLDFLDVRTLGWSTSGSTPGPPPADGVLVAMGNRAFVFGIASDGSGAAVRKPNAAFFWAPSER